MGARPSVAILTYHEDQQCDDEEYLHRLVDVADERVVTGLDDDPERYLDAVYGMAAMARVRLRTPRRYNAAPPRNPSPARMSGGAPSTTPG